MLPLKSFVLKLSPNTVLPDKPLDFVKNQIHSLLTHNSDQIKGSQFN